MLIRLRVEGFRNLLDVDLRPGAFTCLSGRNGAGKSGIFDALRFLCALAHGPIEEAVAGLGPPGEDPPLEPAQLLTSYGSWRARQLRLTAELIVDRRVEDDYGVACETATTALRYTVALRPGPAGGLVLCEEQLLPMGVAVTRRGLGFPSKPSFRKAIAGRRAAPFISTGDGGQVRVHHEGHGGRRFPAARASRTALSGLADSGFPAILAVRRELERWRLLACETSALRRSSSYRDPERLGPRGEHLAATLARLERGDSQVTEALAALLRDMGEDAQAVRVVDDPERRLRSIALRGQDGVSRPAWALSGASLRALAIGTGLLEAGAGGLLCLEDPEDGLHPERIPALVALLRKAAVDTSRAAGAANPMRQVLISTRSPRLVRELLPDELVFVEPMEVERGGALSRIGVLRAAAGSWREALRGGAAPRDDPARMSTAPLAADRRGQVTLPFNDPTD